MQKLVLLPVVVIFSCLIAGLYGALHDQISFTVSPDYFYRFKFEQFRVPEAMHGRLGAAWVGWQASWWMGVLLGLPLGAMALIMPSRRSYLFHYGMALLVVLATALAFGLCGLLYAKAYYTAGDFANFITPAGVADPDAFHHVGYMHGCSYDGGVAGLLAGLVYLVVARWAIYRRPKPSSAESPAP